MILSTEFKLYVIRSQPLVAHSLSYMFNFVEKLAHGIVYSF